jgi:RNA polymerase sigma factor (sigma-70 family)
MFEATQWSLVLASLQSQVAPREAASALSQLCQIYWPPLYSFVRRRGYSPHDAQDLTQGFFVHLLERKGYAKTDPAHGKFRSFLLAAMKNYIADEWDRARTLKRGGGQQFISLDEGTAEAAYEPGTLPELSAEHLFELRWAKALIARTLTVLSERMVAGKKAHVFEGLKPFLTGGAALPTYEEAAGKLGLTIGAVKTHVHRLRHEFRTILREEVARTVRTPEEIDEELRHLRAVLTAGGTIS